MPHRRPTRRSLLIPIVLSTAVSASAVAQDDEPVTVFVYASDESGGNREVEANLPDWAPEGLRFYFDAREARKVIEEFTRAFRKAADPTHVLFADTLGRAEVRLEVVATRHVVPRGQRQAAGPIRLIRLSLRDYGYSTDFLWGKHGTPEGTELRVETFDAPKEVARWIQGNLEQLRQ